jgi:RNA-directed DNA polymerase
MSDSPPKTIAEWRISWQPNDIRWRSKADQWREQRQQERELRRRARIRRDRRYFGEQLWGASSQQRKAITDVEKLRQSNLPEFRSEWELAEWLDINLHRLRWFTHDKPADTVWHYVRYTIPKSNGGKRTILAPKPELKAIQRKILSALLERTTVSPMAHGFVKERSIITNAKQHVGREYVLRLDLKDFFPSITFKRVRGMFISLGYSFAVASVLALLCTEYHREPFDRDGTIYHVSIGKRHLVQGAPTSPSLSNLIAYHLDYRLHGLATKRNFTYTRYADDLIFFGRFTG